MKDYIVLIILIFLCNFISADEKTDYSDEIIGNENLKILTQKGEISRIFRAGENLELLPNISAKEQIKKDIKDIKPSIGVELLLFYKLDENNKEKSEILLSIYNILRSISTLKGIQYYSATRKRMRIFYHDAYVIESPNNRKKTDDPEFSDNIPVRSGLYASFKDSSFGEYTCFVEYLSDGNSITMKIENITQIWYLILPAVSQRNLKSYVIIIPYDEHILFYGLSYLKALNFFGILDSRSDSLYNRVVAISDWFKTEFKKYSK